MPQWSDLGVLVVKNLSVKICNGALSAAHSSNVNFYLLKKDMILHYLSSLYGRTPYQ